MAPSSATLTIMLGVVAAIPPVAQLMHLSAAKWLRLSEDQAATVKRVGPWVYLILIVSLASATWYTARVERIDAASQAEQQHREDAEKLKGLKGQLSALDSMSRRKFAEITAKFSQMQQPLSARPATPQTGRLPRVTSHPAQPLASHVPQATSHPTVVSTPIMPPKTPAAAPAATALAPLWAPMSEQTKTLAGLIAQTPQASAGVWLSQIVSGLGQYRYDGVPPGDTVDFPAALRALAVDGQVEIVSTAKRPYRWGNWVFTDDIEFRLKRTRT